MQSTLTWATLEDIRASEVRSSINVGSFLDRLRSRVVDLLTDLNSSDLMINIDYTEAVRGMQFELDYNPTLIKLRTPRLFVFQDQVMITHSEKRAGILKVVFANLQGGSIEGFNNTFIIIISIHDCTCTCTLLLFQGRLAAWPAERRGRGFPRFEIP